MASILFVLAVSGVWAEPESTPALEGYNRPDECGDPKLVNDAVTLVFGRVLEVREGDIVVVKTLPFGFQLPVFRKYALPNPVTVQLVSIEAPHGSAPGAAQARNALSTLVLGRDVQIGVSPAQISDNALTGSLGVEEELLAKGLVKYRDFGPYALDWWMDCHYKLAEAKAKTAKLGLWTEP